MERITAEQYAKSRGYKRKTVVAWCQRGNLPGAVLQQIPGKSKQFARYMIPADAEPIRPLQKYVKRKTPPTKKMDKPTPKIVLQTPHERAMHIRRFCGTRTYRQLADDTGLTIPEVRRIYERLHDAYGL